MYRYRYKYKYAYTYTYRYRYRYRYTYNCKTNTSDITQIKQVIVFIFIPWFHDSHPVLLSKHHLNKVGCCHFNGRHLLTAEHEVIFLMLCNKQLCKQP